jgi:hypothetical protein
MVGLGTDETDIDRHEGLLVYLAEFSSVVTWFTQIRTSLASCVLSPEELSDVHHYPQ